MPDSQSATPPREWFEEHFVTDGQITYCSICKMIPALFIGHPCMSFEMGQYRGDQITVPYRWEDVLPSENEDRHGDWCLFYQPTESLLVEQSGRSQSGRSES